MALVTQKETIVLVFDADSDFVEYLTRQLPANRIQVIGASSALDGRTLVDKHRPEIVILDPLVQSGMDLLQYVRSTDFPSVVIALTTSSEMTETLHNMGVELIVDKNSESHVLLDAIQAYAGASAVESGDEEPPQILVVDDDKDTVDILSHVLDAWGFSPLSAADGDQALAVLEQNPGISLVLLDLRLPLKGGMEVLREIRSRRPAVNVIMISALADREVAKQAVQMGAFDYVAKPFELASLKSEIIASLSHAEYHKQSWWKRLIG